MEIVIVTGVLALAGLVLLTLRVRAARGSVRKVSRSRQWSGSSGSRGGRAARPAAPAAAGAGGAVAVTSVGGRGGVAVQEPPRTREADLDEWDDDLGWGDDLDEPAPASVAFDEPSGEVAVHEAPAPVAERAPGPEPDPEPAAAPCPLRAA